MRIFECSLEKKILVIAFLLQATFGQFKTLQLTKENLAEVMQQKQEQPTVLGPIKVDVDESPSSLPISMQSSFGSDFVPLPSSTVESPASTGPLSSPPAISNFASSIQEYNLAQLANLAQGPASRNSNPSPAPTPFTLSELLADPNSMSHAYNNLQALAKLGGMSLDNHGKHSDEIFKQFFLINSILLQISTTAILMVADPPMVGALAGLEFLHRQAWTPPYLAMLCPP